MKLLLTSLGLTTDKLIEAFKELLTKPIEEKKVLLISIDTTSKLMRGYIEKAIQRLMGIGILQDYISIYNLTEENPPSIDEVDVVYMDGGNIYHYMKRLRETGLMPEIRSFIERDGVYIGGSAGAMIMCPDIDVNLTMGINDVGLEDLSGFGYVDFYIVPHWGSKDNPRRVRLQEKVEPYSKATGKKIITINDQQGILILDNEYKVI